MLSAAYIALAAAVSLLLINFHDIILNYAALGLNNTDQVNMIPLVENVILICIASVLLITVSSPIFMLFLIKHFKSQLVPLNEQIQKFIDGQFTYRRHMRASDEFLPFMNKVHLLGHKLQNDIDSKLNN